MFNNRSHACLFTCHCGTTIALLFAVLYLHNLASINLHHVMVTLSIFCFLSFKGYYNTIIGVKIAVFNKHYEIENIKFQSSVNCVLKDFALLSEWWNMVHKNTSIQTHYCSQWLSAYFFQHKIDKIPRTLHLTILMVGSIPPLQSNFCTVIVKDFYTGSSWFFFKYINLTSPLK